MAEAGAPEQPAVPESGVIEGVAVLDLTPHTAESLSRIRSIRGVAVVLVPESLAGPLAVIPMTGVASVIPVPDGARISLQTGVVTADGAMLANASGGDRDVLVMTGVLVLTSPVERIGYHTSVVTGVVLAPRGSEAAVATISRLTGVAAYYDYTPGQVVRVFQGHVRLSGAALANATGSPTDVAIVAGQMVVTSPIPRLGFQRVVVAGQLAAPVESQEVLEPALEVVGQAAWYSGHARAFSGKERLTRGFFELLDTPVTLLLSGHFELGPDIPPELLKAKVESIALSGKLDAAPEVLPVAQYLTTDLSGVIGTLDAGE